jgi:voltage-gated potassium channel
MEVPLAVLAIVMLVLLVIDLSNLVSPVWEHRVQDVETLIWVVFVVDFVAEFGLAPSKTRYLRRNWVTAISVLLPAFGVLRVVRAVQLLRGLSLLRILAVFNRGSRALGRIARRGQLGYVAALTVVVILTGAAGVFYFERSEHGASIKTIGDALWWSATVVTTINTSFEPSSLEGRIIGFLLRLFALGFTGYITALIAAYLLGYRGEGGFSERDRAEIRHLHREIAELRALIALSRESNPGDGANRVERVLRPAGEPGFRPAGTETGSRVESDTAIQGRQP